VQFLAKSTILNNGKYLQFLFNNMLLTVNATSDAADGFVGKLQKKFHP